MTNRCRAPRSEQSTRSLVPAAAAAALLLLLCAAAHAQFLRGVTIAGAEFGEQNEPGVMGHDYTYNSQPTLSYFPAKNLTLLRVAIRWERIQQGPGGPLDPANLTALQQDIAWAKAAGGKVVVDIHNYGRYRIAGGGSQPSGGYVIDNAYNGSVAVSRAHFADLWSKLSTVFKNEDGVYAYALMNEPHDMGTADWKAISQAAVDAIRANNDKKLIIVPGNGWSSGNRWVKENGPTAWINDPAGNFVYEAHQYFDHDESGSYAWSYDQELAQNEDFANVGATRLANFFGWCKRNGVWGFLGEYGVPDDDTRWLTVLDRFLSALDADGFGGAYWAAGDWWGSYKLSVQPTNNYTVDRPQTSVLLTHLPPASPLFASVAATNAVGLRLTPGSLASGYGTGLAADTIPVAQTPLPTWVMGAEVQITDSAGQTKSAPLLYVSPTQINYVLPDGIAAGRATVTARYNSNPAGAGFVQIDAVAPSLFTANSDGRGVAAAQIQRLHADGTTTWDNIAVFDTASNRFVPAPINFADSGDRLFLVLYGTGFRNPSTSTSATLQVGSTVLPVLYVGAQGGFAGLDQANVELPRSLAGAGQVDVQLTVDGISANRVVIAFQ